MDATQIIVLLLGIIVGGMNITIFIAIFKLYFKYINDTKNIGIHLKELEICKQDRLYFDENNNSYTIQELSKKINLSPEQILQMDKNNYNKPTQN